MLFYKNLVYTMETGKLGILIHSSLPCTFNCYHCFNKDITNKPKINEEELLIKLHDIVGSSTFEFDLIFSGNEFLDNPVNEIINLFKELRKLYMPDRINIVVYTNGSNPNTMRKISNYVSSFHMDIKVPYWIITCANEERKKIFEDILGVNFNRALNFKFIRSLKILKHRRHLGFDDLTRTVNYPILPRYMITEIEKQMDNYNLPWQLNPFQYKENS